MKVNCISCVRIVEPEFNARDQATGKEGGLCRGCELQASSRVEILVIHGRQFFRTLKRGPVAVDPPKAVRHLRKAAL